MQGLSEAVKDYCGSEHFLFLDPDLKEHAESMLAFWCDDIREPFTAETLNASLSQTGKLDLPADVRKAFPELLREFLEFAATTGRAPGVAGWADLIDEVGTGYADRFRDDGTIRGETFRKKMTDAGRNDPCPCGSGKKFKKCCIELLRE